MKRTLTGTVLAISLAGILSGCGTIGANPAPDTETTRQIQAAAAHLDKTQQKVLNEVVDTIQKRPDRISNAAIEYGSLKLKDKELPAELPDEAQRYRESSSGMVSEASWNFLRRSQVPFDSVVQSWAGILYISELCSDLPGLTDKEIRSQHTASLLQMNANRLKNASADTIKLVRYLLITQSQEAQATSLIPEEKLKSIAAGLPTLTQASLQVIQAKDNATVGGVVANQIGQQQQLPMTVKVPKTAYSVRLQKLEEQLKEYQKSQLLPEGDPHRILHMPLSALQTHATPKN